MKRLHQALIGGAVVLLLAGGWKLSGARSYQLFGDLVDRVETSEKVVALVGSPGTELEFAL